MRKFLCTSGWARNKAGDVVELYMFQRYPKEIREGNFQEIIEKPKPVAKPVAPKEPEVVAVSPEPKKNEKPVA